jgi:UDP-N-acetylmuramoyl-tripeptide--D-alanyl-D-alanine ligase
VTSRQVRLWALDALLWRPFSRFRPLLLAVAAAAFVWRRLMFRTTFIAITGSLGKTTAKECLATILGARYRTVKSNANRNAGLGVCVSVLRVRPWHRVAVLELAGAAPGRLSRSAWVVRPDVGIVLNVLRTHTTTFATLADHAAEKTRLLDALRPGGLAILNADDPLVAAMRTGPGIRRQSFGTSAACGLWAEEVSSRWPARLGFRVHRGDESARVDTQLVGTHWVPSVLAALAAAVSCGMSLSDAAAAARAVAPFPARLDPVRLPGGAIVLRDDYNASIDTLDAACRVLQEANAGRRLFVVNDFSDCGMNRKHRLRRLAEEAARSSDVAFFIGENAAYGRRRAIDAGMEPDDVHQFPSLRAAADSLKTRLRPGDLVLLKGRTTDHAARILFAQLGEVGCWKSCCRKTMLCDSCWELASRPVGCQSGAATGADRVQ